jgi:hypothetical protein
VLLPRHGAAPTCCCAPPLQLLPAAAVLAFAAVAAVPQARCTQADLCHMIAINSPPLCSFVLPCPICAHLSSRWSILHASPQNERILGEAPRPDPSTARAGQSATQSVRCARTSCVSVTSVCTICSIRRRPHAQGSRPNRCARAPCVQQRAQCTSCSNCSSSEECVRAAARAPQHQSQSAQSNRCCCSLRYGVGANDGPAREPSSRGTHQQKGPITW